VPDKKTDTAVKNRTCYSISLAHDLSAEEQDGIKNFIKSESFTINKSRKGKKRLLDIRRLVESLIATGARSLDLVLLSQEGVAAAKPAEILKAVLNLHEEQCLDMSILKVWSKSV